MWGPFILGGLAFLAALFFLVPMLTRTTGGNESPEKSVTERSLSETTASRTNLRRAYLAANGGEALLDGLHSSRARGVLETSFGQVPFLSLKKRPGKSALTLHFPTHEQKIVVDGEAIWQRISTPQTEPKVDRFDPDENKQALQLGAFFDPVMSLLLEGEGTVHAIETGVSEDGSVIIVDFESEELGLRSKAIIDASTLELKSRVDTLADGRERTIRYSDYRSFDGLLVPFVVESYLGEAFENRVTLEQIEFNLGIFPSMFEPPAEVVD